MSTLPTKHDDPPPMRLLPMGISDILEESLRVYSALFRPLITATALIVLPAQCIAFLIDRAAPLPAMQPHQTLTPQQVADVSRSLSFLTLGAFVTAIATTVVAGILAIMINDYYGCAPVRVGSTYRRARGSVATLLGAGFGALIRLTLLSLTVVGGVYYGVAWAFLSQTIVLENMPIESATARSRLLMNGFWWKGLTLIIIVTLISLVASVLNLLLTGIGPRGSILQTVVGIIVAILIVPFQVSTMTLLFYDLKMRKEGFTLPLPRP